MHTFHRIVCCLIVLTLAGCGPSAPGGQPSSSGARSTTADVGPPKNLTIGQPRAREGFAPWFIRGSGRVLQYEELHSNFLVTTDVNGNFEGRLATRLPSLDDGSIAILPDGRMRTTWRLRPNVKWQDGQPFTSEDIVFGWQVATHPEIPVQQSPALRQIETIETPDPLTAVITYGNVFYQAIELGFRDLYPLPRHLLAQPFQGDKEAFQRLPYFSNEYVHTGPYRVKEFVPGETVVLQRFDEYFLGRPKVDTITFRYIGDDNAMISNLLAGGVDIAGEIPTDIAARLRDDWKQSGEGFVVSQQGNWRFISVQFHPEWGGPLELQRDVRTRRGLTYGMDRDAIRNAVVPGFADTEADTFMVRGDPRTPAVGRPFGIYRYDPTRATQEFAEAGWRRAADGRLLNAAGQQVRINLRTTGEYETELSAVANDWRNLGIDVQQEVMTRVLSQDREYIAKFPSVEITAQSNSDGIFRRFNSREQPLAQNRYTGSNAGHYENPAVDRLIDKLNGTLDVREQGLVLKEMGETIAADLPALPMYFSISTVIALKHVRALDDFAGATRVGTTARNAHLWERV